MHAAVCSGCIDMLIFKEPVNETNLCFWLRMELCPFSLHGSTPPPPLPTRQSGSVLLKSNARNRIWQAGEQPLSHRCWENLSFVKDKQQPGCEGRDLPLETRAAGPGSDERNVVEPSMHCFIISPGASDQRNNLLKLPEEWQRQETVTSYCPRMSAGWVWQRGQG